VLVIGENLNATRKSVDEAIISRDREFVENLAKAQVAAGADFIDVNVGSGQQSQEQQAVAMEWLVEVIQAATDRPLVIDSDAPAVIEAALGKYQGDRLIINSVTAESARLESVGPLAVEHQAGLVALAMGASGIPDNAEERLEACELIMAYLTGLGMKAEQVYFDPLVLPIAVDTNQALVTLKTIEQIKCRFPEAKTVIGLSNISYGLPKRKVINRTFLLMAAYAGLDAVIIDPLDAKAMSLIKVADMLTGKDPFCRGYVRAHRSGAIVD